MNNLLLKLTLGTISFLTFVSRPINWFERIMSESMHEWAEDEKAYMDGRIFYDPTHNFGNPFQF